MLAINQPYTLLLIFAAIIPAILAVLALKQRPNPGARSFSVLMTSVSLWAFVSLFEVCSQDPDTKVFSYQIKYLFIVMVPLSWLTFSLYYSNRLRKFERNSFILLLITPAITLLLVATNHYHQLMFKQFEFVTVNNYQLLYPHFGAMFWIHVLYSYILIAIGFVFLISHLINSPAHYQRQVTYLLVGGLAPWVSNITFIFKIGTLTYFDFTPVAFSVSGVAFMWGILRYKLLDIVPIARDVVFQNMKDGIIVVDNDDNIIDLNTTARQLSGIEENNFIGAHAENIIPWWHDLKRYEALAKPAAPPIIELEVEGQIRFLQLNQSPLFNKDKPLGSTLTLHDVTATKLAEKAVSESEERFKSFSENAPVIIFSLDENGALNYANPAWQTLLGHSRGEVLGHPLADFISRDQNQPIDRTFDQLIKGQIPAAEFILHMVHKDGSRHLFNTSASVNSNTEGRVTGIIGLAKDVTEEKRLQQQLFQSQKMEAIGTLAGGIAHDFNNLLMGMQANLSLMRLEAGHSQSFDEKFKRIEDQIQNGASLTRQLLGYARKGKYAVTVFDLNKLVEDALNVVRRTNKSIIVQLRLDEASTFIRADQGQIELVLLNLFVNAIDAMPHGGELRVTTALKIPTHPDNPGAPSKIGHTVEVTVEDTGAGMDKATLDQIFEPFFTTKEVGRGTGLGLASVYGVIQNHCGHIDVKSEPNQGSAFTVRLPAAVAPKNQCRNDEAPAYLPKEGVKILLVDDESLILKYSHEMIASLGISVVSTTDSEEAISLYRDQWEDLDLVVLDMVMPKMDGMQLFSALHEINPNVRVIVTTGYSMDSRISELIACGHHAFLKKPYTRDDLAKSISRLIGTQPRLPKAEKVRAI